jgi:hypothetical protein
MDIEKAAKEAQDRIDQEMAGNPSIRKMIEIVEEFLHTARVMCYGGTAINNLLPEKDRFYDPKTDIPDYDFYSETPQLHALLLSDRFVRAGYKGVEAKPGVHLQTFKVFVDSTAVADITFLEKPIFEKLWNEHIVANKIHYVTPNFLRMSMYLELSRPRGDVSRWTKVYNRLMLLNNHYPVGCNTHHVQDNIQESYLSTERRNEVEKELQKDTSILLGINAAMLHEKHANNKWTLPVDVLVNANHFESVADRYATLFESGGKVKIEEYPAYARLLPKHIDIRDEESGTLLVRVFETLACHSYHELKSGLRVASIPTLLQFFFAFSYADAHFLEGFDENRIICTAQRLMDLIKDHKRRFQILTPIDCMGKQETLFDMREHAAALRSKTTQDSVDFFKFFFTYRPTQLSKSQRQKVRKDVKKTLKKQGSISSVPKYLELDSTS